MRFKVGESYSHNNKLFVRTIDAIADGAIYWHDQIGTGHCSEETFHRQTVGLPLAPEELAAKLARKFPQSNQILMRRPAENTLR